MTYLSFDPGEATGWAAFDDKGAITDFGTIHGLGELFSWLTLHTADVYIIEEYRLYRQRALQQSGSKLLTVQAIGAIKASAASTGSKVVEQPASIKKVAEMWTGYVPKGAHKNSHWIDAVNHGLYYLHKEGIVKTEVKK